MITIDTAMLTISFSTLILTFLMVVIMIVNIKK